jgi:glycosyltransferase involved in cell wall biosynthesis
VTLFESSRGVNKIESQINGVLNKLLLSAKPVFIIYSYFKKIYKFFNEIQSFKDLYRFKNLLSTHFELNQYDLFIITDSTGLATFPNKHFHLSIEKCIFLSLEIEESFLINPFANPFRSYCYYLSKVKLPALCDIIIQDKQRGDLLMQEFNLDKNKYIFHLIPNSISPSNKLTPTTFLKDKFKINKPIIIHIGQISEAALALEIATSLNSQNKYALVFHDKKFTDINDPYLKLIQSSVNYEVYFSLMPVELEILDSIILSANIGILGYSTSFGKNFELITMASGKLIMLLRLGIPVIVKEFPGIRNLIDKYQCGIVVNSWDEVCAAADIINRNRSFYSNNALECFLSEFDFNIYFNKFFDCLINTDEL